MTPYQPDEYRAQHLDGCRLDPDHAGACLLARPFRIRESGGREYLDERDVHEVEVDEVPGGAGDSPNSEIRRPFPGPDTRQRAEQFVRDCIGPEHVADFDVPAIADRLYDLAGSWDVGSVPTFDFWETCKAHDRSQDGDESDDDAAQEVSAPHEGDDAQVLPEVTPHPTSAPHEGDDASPTGTLYVSHTSAPHEGDDALPELTAESSAAEVRWIAREARALATVDDPARRTRLLARKRALLAYIEGTTGARP